MSSWVGEWLAALGPRMVSEIRAELVGGRHRKEPIKRVETGSIWEGGRNCWIYD